MPMRSPDGCLRSVYSIEENAVLNSLYLRWNNIGTAGGKALADALKVNAVLRKLAVQANCFGEEEKQELRDVVEDREWFDLTV